MEMYFKQRLINQIHLEARPEEEHGFSYDVHDDFTVIQEGRCDSESEAVNIDTLIESLNSLKASGANYVSCDWHCDHQELELYGYEFRKANAEEIKEHELKIANLELSRRQKEILRLENELSKLKK